MFGSNIAAGWRARLRQLLGTSEAIPREDLESLLYEVDLSAPIVSRLLDAAEKSKARSREEVLRVLEETTVGIAREVVSEARDLPVPGAILLLGVNGVGKTTVAAKLAKHYIGRGKKVVLAAADTFRAGAIEQIKIWGERVGAEVVAGQPGSDPASVVFDAWRRAVAQGGVLIADTAGRMHTQAPLMEQIKKVVRILGKDGRGAPHETFLVLDGTTGQNAVSQAREFLGAVPVTGLIVTKLDGTAKGGSVLSSSLALSVPIRYVGVGEKATDLALFDPMTFAKELFEA
jgi:fused signal recognition particle receptor